MSEIMHIPLWIQAFIAFCGSIGAIGGIVNTVTTYRLKRKALDVELAIAELHACVDRANTMARRANRLQVMLHRQNRQVAAKQTETLEEIKAAIVPTDPMDPPEGN